MQTGARTLDLIQRTLTESTRYYREEVAPALSASPPEEVRPTVARVMRIAKLFRIIDSNPDLMGSVPESLDPSPALTTLRVVMDSMVCAASKDPAIREYALDRAGLDSYESDLGVAAWTDLLDS